MWGIGMVNVTIYIVYIHGSVMGHMIRVGPAFGAKELLWLIHATLVTSGLAPRHVPEPCGNIWCFP